MDELLPLEFLADSIAGREQYAPWAQPCYNLVVYTCLWSVKPPASAGQVRRPVT
jgi:hypothetical protein